MSCAPTCAAPVCYPSYCSSGGSRGDLIGGSSARSRIGGAGAYGISPYAMVGCVQQLPSSELCTQRSPFIIVQPGAMLANTCQSPTVTGYTACVDGYGGYGGYGSYGNYGGSGGYGSYGYSSCRPC